MKTSPFAITDANEACASVAYRLSENIAIYPITPSSPMAELADEWSTVNTPNLWGDVPTVVQMQSEAGVAGALHGTLTGGTLSTSFTASQGLLLMIPNMYKIAGELTPFCLHVTARSLATHALSIFGDHSDVMACRQTGFAMLCSNNVQEAQDMAAIAHLATLRSRVPFLHFFDGFRTSHEINTYTPLDDDTLRALVDEEAVSAHRRRGLTPDAPVIRGTAQNPDVFFQAREAANPYYEATVGIVEHYLHRFAELTGRQYHLFEYYGHPEAEDVVILMGSATETCSEVVDALNAEGRKTGVLMVRLYRPFSLTHFLEALPSSVRRIAILDRTKEPGALGEPLFTEIMAALGQAALNPTLQAPRPKRVIGGRYGLGSKEFSPAMAKAVFDNLACTGPIHPFTVGIMDDVSHTSLKVDNAWQLPGDHALGAVFIGLGSDGTVGANKNTIKIIGEETPHFAQAYFVYDSKKSGAMTVSHLRFGPEPIRAPYLIEHARFVGIHQWQFVHKMDTLRQAAPGATVLLNSPYPASQVWEKLPPENQTTIRERNLKLYVIDAYAVAREHGMGSRINTVMQTCFFAISGILPRDEAIEKIKYSIEKTYARKGRSVVEKNFAAVDATIAHLEAVTIPAEQTASVDYSPTVPLEAPDFVQRVTAVMLRGDGDLLPVSAFPADGEWPTSTSRWEKRNIATEIPTWDPDLCIQCGKCALICPHAAIRGKYYPEDLLADAPESFLSSIYKNKDVPGQRFTIQVAPEDCTGCNLCVTVCPAKDKSNPRHKAIDMTPIEGVLDTEKARWSYFEKLPHPDPTTLGPTLKDSQLREPLFEFSGACAGCGETPYIKLLTQLFGDRMMIANATGCSSIYGGNLPTTPYCTNDEGRGPAWSNSLFEDNAEFALGLRLAADKKKSIAERLLRELAPTVSENLATAILEAPMNTDAELQAQRERVADLKSRIQHLNTRSASRLFDVADFLVKKSVWAIGGDGWAYDIGYGGLDHVLSTGRNVNIIVLDTEVYSNTGGQASKSTPLGAVAKFATGGKTTPKKDMGLLAMGYGNVYVASIAIGANDRQTLEVLREAESFDGPSLIIAYSHCIAHGYNLNSGIDQQKRAVESGHWLLYRHDPRRIEAGEPALKLESKAAKIRLRDYQENEIRYRILQQSDPARAGTLHDRAQGNIHARRHHYEGLSTPKTTDDSAPA